MEIKLTKLKCKRCGHGHKKPWYPRKEQYPKICPKCKSPYWDTTKK